MSLIRSSGGMFGIKLVGPDFREFDFFGKNLTMVPSLMCFPDSREGRRVASVIPIGHKSLVYLMAPVKRFWAAIEYIDGTIDEGKRAAISHGAIELLEVCAPHFAKVFRCVRVVARVDDPTKAPTPDFGFQKGDVGFDIDECDYLKMFNDIPWDYRVNSD